MTKNLKYKNPLSKKVKNDILGQLLPFQKKIEIFDLKKLHPGYNLALTIYGIIISYSTPDIPILCPYNHTLYEY